MERDARRQSAREAGKNQRKLDDGTHAIPQALAVVQRPTDDPRKVAGDARYPLGGFSGLGYPKKCPRPSIEAATPRRAATRGCVKRRMSARKSSDSEHDGDLVNPSFGAGATPEPPPAARPSADNGGSAPTSGAAPPNPLPPNQSNVLVGGGEREARAYVGPTALPTVAAPKPTDGAGKVAIASSVDPRRMPTVRISPGHGRARPPLAPGERPAPPEAMVAPFGPVSPRPTPPPALVAPHGAPHSVPPSAAKVSSRRDPTGSPATAIWVLAVVLAALIGAGAALWIRRNMAAKEPPPPAPAPAAPHS